MWEMQSHFSVFNHSILQSQRTCHSSLFYITWLAHCPKQSHLNPPLISLISQRYSQSDLHNLTLSKHSTRNNPTRTMTQGSNKWLWRWQNHGTYMARKHLTWSSRLWQQDLEYMVYKKQPHTNKTNSNEHGKMLFLIEILCYTHRLLQIIVTLPLTLPLTLDHTQIGRVLL